MVRCMSVEENIAMIKDWFEDTITNVQNTEHYFTKDATFWTSDNIIKGRDQILDAWTNFFSVLVPKSYEIHNVIAQGNEIAVEFTATHTHVGEYAGIPATGKDITWDMVYVFTLKDRRIKSVRDYFNVPGYAHKQQIDYLKA